MYYTLLNRVNTLEKQQAQTNTVIHFGGKRIQTGATMIGIGTLLSVVGSLVLALSPSTQTYNGYTGATTTKLSGGQIAGLVLGGVGFGLQVGGIISIANGGAKLNHIKDL
jgi:hypothetical protein